MANPTTKEWAVLVYMAADVSAPGMHRAAQRSLLQMADMGSTDQVYVAAQIDSAADHFTRRYIFPPKPADTDSWVVLPKESIPDTNSADPLTILKFFAWGISECPAKNIMLVFWAHGFGLDDYQPTGVWPIAFPAPGPTATTFSFFPTDGAKEISIPAKNFVEPLDNNTFRAIVDEHFHKVLDNNQIGDVVRGCREMLGEGNGDLAILGMDCCEMAMAEVWCEMTGGAQIGIASQAGIPYSSWPYDLLLAKLQAEPEAAPDTVAHMMVDSYAEFYNSRKKPAYVTLSACNLNLCIELEAAVKPLAEALAAVSGDVKARKGIFSARNSSPSFDPDGYIDLDCFCAFLSEDVPDDRVRQACGPVRHVLKKFVIDSVFSPQDPDRMISLSKGVSVWFPPWIEDPLVGEDQKKQSEAYLWHGYGGTQFAEKTGWDVFLKNMVNNNP